MAFAQYLLAVPHSDDRQWESSRFNGNFNLEKIRKANRLVDVSQPLSYDRDFEAVLSYEEFPEFIDVAANGPLKEWYDNLSGMFETIIVCHEEFESGCGD